MQKIRKYAILLIAPLHAAYMLAMLYGPRADYLYGAALLLVLLADFALSAWQLGLFTSKHGRIREFIQVFRPYLWEKLAVLGAEWLMLLIIGRGDVLHSEVVLLAAVCFLSMVAVSSGLVCFAAGCARTMLYHDEKR